MAMPLALSATVARLLNEGSPSRLPRAVDELSTRYRTRNEQLPYIRTKLDVLAYVAYRLPATYAAAEAVFREIRTLRPAWHPHTLLDAGAGPGTATWSASAVWPSLKDATLLEPDGRMRSVARRVTTSVPLRVRMVGIGIERATFERPFDLVVAAYALGELPTPRAAVATLWAATGDTLAVIEPGTPRGFATVLAAREQLVGDGAHTVAPCTHDNRCPLGAGDWCHFSQRLPRSRAHRLAKEAERGFEDEKYSYAVLSRTASAPGGARVIREPRRRRGLVSVACCSAEGLVHRNLSRRDGAAYDEARRLKWGDRIADATLREAGPAPSRRRMEGTGAEENLYR